MNEAALKIRHNRKIITMPAGFPGSICLSGNPKGKTGRAALLRKAREVSSILNNGKSVFIDPGCRLIRSGHNRHGILKAAKNIDKSKVLLFRNIFSSAGKEENRWFSPGALYLSSSLKMAGFRVILSGFLFARIFLRMLKGW